MPINKPISLIFDQTSKDLKRKHYFKYTSTSNIEPCFCFKTEARLRFDFRVLLTSIQRLFPGVTGRHHSVLIFQRQPRKNLHLIRQNHPEPQLQTRFGFHGAFRFSRLRRRYRLMDHRHDDSDFVQVDFVFLGFFALLVLVGRRNDGQR